RLLVRPGAARVGHRLEGGGEVAVRGGHGRDEARRLHQHPGLQEAPCRLDDAGRTDRVVGCALWGGHLMRPQPLICVRDVEASSRWYQRLLGCESAHGGPNYERLVISGKLVLQLHRWEVEHHHGPIGDPTDMPPGNGLLLWFEIDDIDAAMARAEEMGAEVI